MGVRALAVLPGRIQERLVGAFREQLHQIRANELPEPLSTEWDGIRNQVTEVTAETQGQGSLEATIERMTDEEASLIAHKIVEMAYRVDGMMAEQEIAAR